jgi:hypothetical protein
MLRQVALSIERIVSCGNDNKQAASLSHLHHVPSRKGVQSHER